MLPTMSRRMTWDYLFSPSKASYPFLRIPNKVFDLSLYLTTTRVQVVKWRSIINREAAAEKSNYCTEDIFGTDCFE